MQCGNKLLDIQCISCNKEDFRAGRRHQVSYNRGMRKGLLGLVVLCFVVSPGRIRANTNAGAYLEPTGNRAGISTTWLIPPYAVLSMVNAQSDIYASYIDSGTGSLITELPIPGENEGIIAVFYSDGTGLSSRISVDFSQDGITVLMPPTIYSRKLLSSLGFVGTAYPQSQIEVEIVRSNNEKMNLNSLADNTGEWQIETIKLSPDKYQARARAIYHGQYSAWSQDMNIEVLTPLDQAIEDFGKQTRDSLDQAIDKLPTPLRSVVQTIDDRSTILSTFLLPTLLTLTTVTQSGILIQNLFYLIYQGLIGLLQLLGLIKRRAESGVVYDAATKKPIGRAIVRLYESGTHRLVETDVTSSEGTFSFLPPEGYYYLRVSKPGYIYPSRLVLGKHDGRYSSVYLGGDLQITASHPVIRVEVPIDPEAFVENFQMKISAFWQRWIEPANRWLLMFGFFLAVLSYSRQPTRINFMILVLYLVTSIYYFLQGRTFNRDYGVVTSDRGKPLSGVELNLIDVEFNRLVSRRVTDAKGRYQFLVPPGKYQIKMVTPDYSLVKSVKKTYQGGEISVPGEKGQSKRISPKIMVKRA